MTTNKHIRYPGSISSFCASKGIKVKEFLANIQMPHFPQNAQTEPTIVVNPLNPCNIIVASNSRIFNRDGFPIGVNQPPPQFSSNLFDPRCAIYTTRDGGKTWNIQALQWDAAGLVARGDPVLAYGPRPDTTGSFSFDNGVRFYLVNLAFPVGNSQRNFIAVSYSDDGGQVWSSPVIVSQPVIESEDKPWITVDRSPSSPFFGRVYVAWTREPPVGFSTGFSAFSTDGGVTYSAPIQFAPTSSTATGIFNITDQNGNLYIFLRIFISGFKVAVIKSSDGGLTFSAPIVIDVSPNVAPIIGQGNFLNSPSSNTPPNFPQAAIDANGTLYCVYLGIVTNNNTQVVVNLARSFDQGATWEIKTVMSSPAYNFEYQSIAIFENRIVIASNGFDNVPPDTIPGADVVHYNAFIVYSNDLGNTFSDLIRINKRPSDVAVSSTLDLRGEFIGDYNTLVVDTKGNFWFTWASTQFGNSCEAVDAFRLDQAPYPNIFESCSLNFGHIDIIATRIKFFNNARTQRYSDPWVKYDQTNIMREVSDNMEQTSSLRIV